MINKNPYYEAMSDKKLMFLFCLMYLIPIGVYVVQFVCYLLRKKIDDIVIPFLIYIFLLFIFVVLIQPSIDKSQVIQNEGDITSYKEMIVRSTFINDSIEGKDYIIKYEDENGKEKEEIIKTRTHDSDIVVIYHNIDIVEIYPHQEEAYFEKYVTVEESISFFGNINEEVLDEVTYKLYLTDDIV